jgi:4-amino-4-deoxy-L-arabinose transferase-like glycosyltransferase
MRSPVFDSISAATIHSTTRLRVRGDTWRWFALASIVALAVALRFSNLDALGYSNHYYTAGVESMLQSWRNFFFVAAEPGGAVSIDKPPLGLWLQAISAAIFGVNGFGVLLPQLLAGVLSVVVVYHLVRRSYGTPAGLLAALALAVTPVSVAVDRNNTIDSTLILALLLAAWAFIKATETPRLRFLLLGAVLVGLAFNIKMLAAFLPLPAFYALYFLGAREKLWRKIGKLTLATVVLLAVSLSWAVIVELTPADQRPYVGSSTNNSVIELMVDYNGLERLTGTGGPGGAPDGGGAFGGAFDGNMRGMPPGAPPGQPPNDGTRPQRSDGGPQPQGQNNGFSNDGQGQSANGFPQGGPPQGGPPQGPGGSGGGGGGAFNTGQPGPFRLLTGALSNELSWLLPLGLFSIALLVFLNRLRWPIGLEHQAAVLWGGWLLIGMVFFSIAGFFHSYYLSILAPPLAALVGIGAAALWKISRTHRWLAIALLLIASSTTLCLQVVTSRNYTNTTWWLVIAGSVFAIGVTLLLIVANQRRSLIFALGFITIIVALLITPSVWSELTNLNASNNQSLPGAYSGQTLSPGGLRDVQVNQQLVNFLQDNTQGMKYLMAVPSAMQGADYVIATGRPVLYLGGFMGRDPVLTVDGLRYLIETGQLRYIYSDAGNGGGQSNVSSWVRDNCTNVEGFSASTQNAGAPDGTLNRGNMAVSLYDCVVN